MFNPFKRNKKVSSDSSISSFDSNALFHLERQVIALRERIGENEQLNYKKRNELINEIAINKIELEGKISKLREEIAKINQLLTMNVRIKR